MRWQKGHGSGWLPEAGVLGDSPHPPPTPSPECVEPRPGHSQGGKENSVTLPIEKHFEVMGMQRTRDCGLDPLLPWVTSVLSLPVCKMGVQPQVIVRPLQQERGAEGPSLPVLRGVCVRGRGPLRGAAGAQEPSTNPVPPTRFAAPEPSPPAPGGLENPGAGDRNGLWEERSGGRRKTRTGSGAGGGPRSPQPRATGGWEGVWRPAAPGGGEGPGPVGRRGLRG